MPQELALLEDFTIAENMYFFGQLLGMPGFLIYKRITFLCSFFQLLPADRFVKTLSGGQQRRVSLAVALMHSPPFMILDEPTVGLDPVLRDAIWRYFVVLSREQSTTIVVTTHFIEEIADAALVGIMRNAKIWCERPPSELISLYGPGTLSDAYLKVCQRLDFPGGDRQPMLAAPKQTKPVPLPASMMTWTNWASVRSVTRVRALVAKNLLKIMRRVVCGRSQTIVFQLVMPSCVGVVFCLFVGGNPTDLSMAVVNQDPQGLYPRLFLEFIDADIIVKKPYSSREEAFAAVRREDAWGVIYVPENYTENFKLRLVKMFVVKQQMADMGTIDVYLDATDNTIRGVIIKELHRAHETFVKYVSSNLTGVNISIELLKASGAMGVKPLLMRRSVVNHVEFVGLSGGSGSLYQRELTLRVRWPAFSSPYGGLDLAFRSWT
ncbi:ABC transporter G family member 23-like [Amblyomma americanum]